MPDAQEMYTSVANLVAESSDGVMTAADATRPGHTLVELGLSSLAYLRLIDAIENRYGVYIDLEEAAGKLGTVEQIVDYMVSQGAVSGA
ncbi:acyl carrier protein [Amycolatopsis sp. NPDC005232]|uniref:acyl carrier protein n=1 Tax=unclassified Amycolatopsis TaxID=2618356 RepID=UPI001C697D17|nr:acyl carrier protein [Amycolatopsis sp. DSM 110486]QYN17770.1 acyl carrier protein [Amycolatopsis sp. DSM 110486]